MKITNNQNLPDALVQAISTNRHNEKGCYSATTLLKGACETILTERYFDEIEVDAADSIWQVFGTATHSIFEKQNDNSFKEESFSVQVSNSKVTGRVDAYNLETETIIDWKTASVWKIQFADFDDWKKQGLIYAWLLKQSGLSVKRCEFIALLKDHSKSKARNDTSYPQSPVYKYAFDVTDAELEEIENFIKVKIAELEEAEKLADWEIKPCSNEERWASGEKWAVMKTGRKTALKVCESEEEAKELLSKLGGTNIEFRAGCSRRCEDYCSCNTFCPFYKKTLSNN